MWVDDAHVTHCLTCNNGFSLMLRKVNLSNFNKLKKKSLTLSFLFCQHQQHHCRVCLKIYCYYCCNNWIEYNNRYINWIIWKITFVIIGITLYLKANCACVSVASRPKLNWITKYKQLLNRTRIKSCQTMRRTRRTNQIRTSTLRWDLKSWLRQCSPSPMSFRAFIKQPTKLRQRQQSWRPSRILNLIQSFQSKKNHKVV